MPARAAKQKQFLLILFTLHAILLIALYSKFGLNSSNEGDKYLTSAREILNGNFSKALEYQWFYSVYIFYLALLLALHLPVAAVFFITYVISLFSFYRFSIFLNKFISPASANIWLVLTLLSPLLMFWEFQLYSEVFFISLSLLFTSSLFLADSGRQFFSVTVFGILLVFCRPSGIFVVSTMLAAWMIYFQIISRKTVIASGIFDTLLIFAIIIFFVPMHYKGVCEVIASGSVYCGFPTLNTPEMPGADSKLSECYSYLIENAGAGTVISLLFKKFFSFFILTRGHYSFSHNLLNISHYLFYPFFIISLFIKKQENFSRIFFRAILALVLINAALVALFFNEWTERYTVQVFPFIFAGAAFTLDHLYKKLLKKNAV